MGNEMFYKVEEHNSPAFSILMDWEYSWGLITREEWVKCFDEQGMKESLVVEIEERAKTIEAPLAPSLVEKDQIDT